MEPITAGKCGGMKADDVKRLKELERENGRLKRIVADQALDIAALKDVAEDAPIDRVEVARTA
jgi:hypothetical protein